MSFKKNKYIVVRQAISKDLALFIYNYFLMQKQVYDTCRQRRYISPYETLIGEYQSINLQKAADGHIPQDTYSQYANIAMETLMLKCQPMMEKTTGLKLYPTYTFARLYKNGDILERHKDRFSCEISTTMNLGGDDWPIYLDPTHPKILPAKGPYKIIGNKGVKVNLKPGDMLVYKGRELEHWREKFKGQQCVQVFLHYNNRKTSGSKDNQFDKRPHLGLPKSMLRGG
jgi:hypothetical protein